VPSRVEAGDGDLAVVGDAKSDDAFEQRRLASAIRPEQTEDLTLAYV
jgi:hypothetical protein